MGGCTPENLPLYHRNQNKSEPGKNQISSHMTPEVLGGYCAEVTALKSIEEHWAAATSRVSEVADEMTSQY